MLLSRSRYAVCNRPTKKRNLLESDLEVLALDDGDGEAGDGLVEADGEEDLGPLVGQVRRLDVPLQVGVQVQLPRGEVEVLHGEEGLADDAVPPVHVDVVHQQPQGARVDRQRGRLKKERVGSNLSWVKGTPIALKDKIELGLETVFSEFH